LAKALVSDTGADENSVEFLRAAIAHDAPTTRAFGPFIDKLDRTQKLMMLMMFSKAGVTLDHPPMLNKEDVDVMRVWPELPDPYDWTSGKAIWNNLDLLWSDFLATGTKRPIEAITHALTWQADYDAFAAMQKKGEKPTELTASITRAVTFSAAGWSLCSFDGSDPLAADYIQAIHADAKTSPEVRAVLETLYTNPAFKHH
jgi:hypothetical protein